MEVSGVERQRLGSEGNSSLALHPKAEFDGRIQLEHVNSLSNGDQPASESCKQDPDGIIHFDPDGNGNGSFNLMLSPLIRYSPYIKRHAEKTDTESMDDEKKDKKQLVLRIFGCPGDVEILKIVELYCNGLMEGDRISTLNVVKLIATCNFLEIDGLENIALQFLDENLVSARSCINVLVTFDGKTSRDSKLANVFNKCKDALIEHITRTETAPDGRWSRTCTFQSLLIVAQRTPPAVAAQIFESCKERRLGLYLEKSSSDTSQPVLTLSRSVLVCYHLLKRKSSSKSIVNASFGYYSFSSFGGKEIGWLDSVLDRLQNLPKKLIFLLHMAKSVTLGSCPRTSSDLVQITHSHLQWGFLCVILKQSARLIDTMTYRNFSADPRDLANLKDLDKEVVHFQKIIGKSLAHRTLWESKESCDLVFQSLKLFDFKNILRIVRHFNELPMSAARSTRSRYNLFYDRVVELLDILVEERFKAGTLCTREAMVIFQEFPMNANRNLAKIYDVFRAVVTRPFESDSGEGLLQFMEWLDLDQIPDEVLEKICIPPSHGCHLLRRIVKVWKAEAACRDRGAEKREMDQEVIKLLHELEGQKTEALALRKNCAEILDGKADAESRFCEMKAKCLKLEEENVAAESTFCGKVECLENELRDERSKCLKIKEVKEAALATESQYYGKRARLVDQLRSEKSKRLKLEEKVAEESRLKDMTCKLVYQLHVGEENCKKLEEEKAAEESRLKEMIGRLGQERQVEHERVMHLEQSNKALESKLKDAEENLETEQRSCENERKRFHEVQEKLEKERENGKKCSRAKTDMLSKLNGMKVKLKRVSNRCAELVKNKNILLSQLKAEKEKTDLLEKKAALLESELKDEKEKSACQICFVKKPDTIIFPCMHFSYCADCLENFFRKSNTCPTCRGSIGMVQKYYSSA